MWYGDIHNTLIAIGFTKCASDSCVYIKTNINDSGRSIIIGLFVDDVLILFDKQDEPQWLKLKEI